MTYELTDQDRAVVAWVNADAGTQYEVAEMRRIHTEALDRQRAVLFAAERAVAMRELALATLPDDDDDDDEDDEPDPPYRNVLGQRGRVG